MGTVMCSTFRENVQGFNRKVVEHLVAPQIFAAQQIARWASPGYPSLVR